MKAEKCKQRELSASHQCRSFSGESASRQADDGLDWKVWKLVDASITHLRTPRASCSWLERSARTEGERIGQSFGRLAMDARVSGDVASQTETYLRHVRSEISNGERPENVVFVLLLVSDGRRFDRAFSAEKPAIRSFQAREGENIRRVMNFSADKSAPQLS